MSGTTGRAHRVRSEQLRKPGRNFVIALLLSYAAFFDYAVFFADSGPGAPQPDGELVLASCEPNWLVFGARAHCTGTVTPGPNHLREGTPSRYDMAFSRFEESEVGKPIQVHDPSKSDSGKQWHSINAVERPFTAELLIGVFALFALCFWYITIMGVIALLVRKLRGSS